MKLCRCPAFVLMLFQVFSSSRTRLKLLKQCELIRMRRAFKALMRTKINAIDQARIALCEHLKRLCARTGEAFFLPDFIKPARIASVTVKEILATDAQPARNPNIDRVRLGKRSARNGTRGTVYKCNGHWLLNSTHQSRTCGLDLLAGKISIANNNSDLMAGFNGRRRSASHNRERSP
ncbi:hypothetical protein [Hyphomicrobium sp. D-2]|uniref:hypothetical protein n=1 Tax=Hyphomicrobium sp. D-2 TaxID=3041621 RepID=UPI0024563038|nr:hypothetical protein [Hyphomicrobium sp. D-2]MDH4983473.1 hypothetical protein [Hyphomicrobium sp. D-2]